MGYIWCPHKFDTFDISHSFHVKRIKWSLLWVFICSLSLCLFWKKKPPSYSGKVPFHPDNVTPSCHFSHSSHIAPSRGDLPGKIHLPPPLGAYLPLWKTRYSPPSFISTKRVVFTIFCWGYPLWGCSSSLCQPPLPPSSIHLGVDSPFFVKGTPSGGVDRTWTNIVLSYFLCFYMEWWLHQKKIQPPPL